MSASPQHRIAAAPSTTAADWRELAHRTGDGLEISLLWCAATGRVKVTVVDARNGVGFGLDVAGADALGAFHHPFVYAGARDVAAGPPARTLHELQPLS